MPFRTLLFTLFGLLLALSAQAQDVTSPTVGVEARIQQRVLPGPEIEVRPLSECTVPLVVRITGIYPHGSAYRYDISYYGLEAGTFDLRRALLRRDGSALEGVPPIPVTIEAVLSADRIKPNPPEHAAVSIPASYRSLLIGGGVIWLIGLGLLLSMGRRRAAARAAEQAAVTVEDRLRALVDAAVAGSLASQGQAELERILLSCWTRKLGLEELSAGEAMAAMRASEEAGPLVRQLEEWLHRPGPKDKVKIDELLQTALETIAERGAETSESGVA